MKTCTRCGHKKPVTEYNKNKSRKDGFQSVCRVCDNKSSRGYYAANSEILKNKIKNWQEVNQTKVATYKAKWKFENKDKVRISGSNYYIKNLEKAKAERAKWAAANREAACIYSHNRRALKQASGGVLSKGLTERLFELQKGKCACGCGLPLGDDFHRDHIMPLALGGENEDWNIQLLTQQCNHRKHAKHPIVFMQERGFLL